MDSGLDAIEGGVECAIDVGPLHGGAEGDQSRDAREGLLGGANMDVRAVESEPDLKAMLTVEALATGQSDAPSASSVQWRTCAWCTLQPLVRSAYFSGHSRSLSSGGQAIPRPAGPRNPG